MKAAFRSLIRPLLENQLRRLIRRHHLKVVTVTGSVGKTSTKQFTAAVLGAQYRVLVHAGNYNDSVSVPLAAFGLTMPSTIINPLAWLWRLWQMEQMIDGAFDYDVLVLELVTDHPGEIAHFASYLKPDVGVITAVAPEHMEYFGTLEAVAREEFAIGTVSDAVIVALDDTTSSDRKKYLSHDVECITYGLSRHANVSTHATKTGTAGTFLTVTSRSRGEITAMVPVIGEPALKAIAAAIAVGERLGLTESVLKDGLNLIRPVAGRMQTLRGLNETVIIDDSYNSSPDAVVAALKALHDLSGTGRRIAIMGAMNELGTQSPQYHREAGARCAELDLLVTLGELASTELGPAAIAAGLDPKHWQKADSPRVAGEYVRLIAQPGDIILVKGSQNGVFAEEAIPYLLADPADQKRLVRQSASWLKVKQRQFPDLSQ